MIKRYDFEFPDIVYGEGPHMDRVESLDGQYVEYDDVVDLIKRCIEDETVDDIVGNLVEGFGFENHI